MIQRLKEDWKNTDKILVLVEVLIILSTVFMGFQFLEYRNALVNEGCRYYYSEHVPGWSDTGGSFMNRTEYKKAKSFNENFLYEDNYSNGLD